jgi:hypothetical protein
MSAEDGLMRYAILRSREQTHLEVGILDDPFKIIQNANPWRSSRVEPGQR